MTRNFAILIATAALLSGCAWFNGKHEDKFAKCPRAEMLAAGQGWISPPGDAWAARAQISEFATQCKVTKTAIVFTVTPKIQAERSGDAKNEMKQALPLYLAVTRGDDIVQKKMFTRKIAFDAGKRIAEDTFDLPIELPLGDAGTAADRAVMLAFQLDATQLDYMRQLREAPVKAVLPVISAPALPK